MANTDQNGRFVIRGVAPGEYLVMAVPASELERDRGLDFHKRHEADASPVTVAHNGKRQRDRKTGRRQITAASYPVCRLQTPGTGFLTGQEGSAAEAAFAAFCRPRARSVARWRLKRISPAHFDGKPVYRPRCPEPSKVW